MTHQDRDDELEFHVEMLVRRYESEGLDPPAARRKAAERMGDLTAAAAARRSIDRRGESPSGRNQWFRGWMQDLRSGWRVLRRAPGFLTIAILMLGLGTGASAAIFSVVDGVILRSPFRDVDHVFRVSARQADGQVGGLTRDEVQRLASTPASLVTGIGIDTIATPVVSRVGIPKRTRTVCLSAAMPAVIGTQPRLGRWFTEGEARPGASPVAVVSHTFWQQTLGADPSAVGRVVALDGTPVTIIGVMPPGFDGPYPRLHREVWVPYWPTAGGPQPHGCPAESMFVPLARVRPGADPEAATRELNAIAGASALVLSPYADELIGDLRSPMQALVGAVLAVLLIAFANVANLGLERLAGRRREVALRLALGATRTRVVREIVAEHLLVSIAGGLAGLAFAKVSFGGLVALLPEWLPNLDAVALNARVLLASLTLAILGGVGAGGVAAWHTSTSALGASLAANERGQTNRRSLTRRALVTAELALGVLLLVGALLMVRTFLTLRPSDPGFDAEGKHIALIRLPADTPPNERLAFTTGMLDALSRRPGIRAVAATTSVPMRRSVSVLPASAGANQGNVFTGVVTPNYFDMMGIPVRRGRGLTEADHAGSPMVAVINETLAARWFAGEGALGQSVTVGRNANRMVVRIVGVVGDIRSFGHDTTTRPFLYVPIAQALTGNAFLMIDVDRRAAIDVATTVRSAVAAVRPGALVDEVERLADDMQAEVSQPRLGAWLFGLFAALALLLAAVGLAATLAWSVAQRRREIGIRMALGARPRDVSRLVTGDMLAMSLTGVVVGLLVASLTTGLLEGWLYGVTPLDPATFVSCGALMLAVSAIAAYIPARRATRVDPVVTLRGDS